MTAPTFPHPANHIAQLHHAQAIDIEKPSSAVSNTHNHPMNSNLLQLRTCAGPTLDAVFHIFIHSDTR